MKILLSPAKSINFEISVKKNEATIPQFIPEAEYLIGKLSKLSARQIGSLMKVSNDIAELNAERFKNWQLPFTSENSKPAADIFTGMAYQGLDFPTLSADEREFGQKTLRILSGLYGMLKPLDLIQPYRLEMGTSFKVTAKMKNLYLYWGDKIVDALNAELLPNEPVVNLASSEYFKAAKLSKIKTKVITPVFKDLNKKGEFKVVMTFAKKARGLMSRFVLEHKIENEEGLKAFDLEGYYFCSEESSRDEWVFKRG
ncbi:MAG: peroxide stress protein YaaA [Putridiphycobacter sp.]|nr:peroxide stress protein YaaA [Putridiphycobacter sp.]